MKKPRRGLGNSVQYRARGNRYLRRRKETSRPDGSYNLVWGAPGRVWIPSRHQMRDSKLNFHTSARIGVGASPPPIHVSLFSHVKKSVVFVFLFFLLSHRDTNSGSEKKKPKNVFFKKPRRNAPFWNLRLWWSRGWLRMTDGCETTRLEDREAGGGKKKLGEEKEMHGIKRWICLLCGMYSYFCRLLGRGIKMHRE